MTEYFSTPMGEHRKKRRGLPETYISRVAPCQLRVINAIRFLGQRATKWAIVRFIAAQNNRNVAANIAGISKHLSMMVYMGLIRKKKGIYAIIASVEHLGSDELAQPVEPLEISKYYDETNEAEVIEEAEEAEEYVTEIAEEVEECEEVEENFSGFRCSDSN